MYPLCLTSLYIIYNTTNNIKPMKVFVLLTEFNKQPSVAAAVVGIATGSIALIGVLVAIVIFAAHRLSGTQSTSNTVAPAGMWRPFNVIVKLKLLGVVLFRY